MIGGRGGSISTVNPAVVEVRAPEVSEGVCETRIDNAAVRSTAGMGRTQFQEPFVPVPAHGVEHVAEARFEVVGTLNFASTVSPGAQVFPPTSVLVAMLKSRFPGNL